MSPKLAIKIFLGLFSLVVIVFSSFWLYQNFFNLDMTFEYGDGPNKTREVVDEYVTEQEEYERTRDMIIQNKLDRMEEEGLEKKTQREIIKERKDDMIKEDIKEEGKITPQTRDEIQDMVDDHFRK